MYANRMRTQMGVPSKDGLTVKRVLQVEDLLDQDSFRLVFGHTSLETGKKRKDRG